MSCFGSSIPLPCTLKKACSPSMLNSACLRLAASLHINMRAHKVNESCHEHLFQAAVLLQDDAAHLIRPKQPTWRSALVFLRWIGCSCHAIALVLVCGVMMELLSWSPLFTLGCAIGVGLGITISVHIAAKVRHHDKTRC